MCQEFCPWGVYPSMHWGRHPPCPVHAGIHTTPPGQTSLQADPPPLGRQLPLSRRPLQGTVRILLECILVIELFSISPKVHCFFKILIGLRLRAVTSFMFLYSLFVCCGLIASINVTCAGTENKKDSKTNGVVTLPDTRTAKETDEKWAVQNFVEVFTLHRKRDQHKFPLGSSVCVCLVLFVFFKKLLHSVNNVDKSISMWTSGFLKPLVYLTSGSNSLTKPLLSESVPFKYGSTFFAAMQAAFLLDVPIES